MKRKKGKRSKSAKEGKSKSKRFRRERFWVEDCKDLKRDSAHLCRLCVLITRVELSDNHMVLKADERVISTSNDSNTTSPIPIVPLQESGEKSKSDSRFQCSSSDVLSSTNAANTSPTEEKNRSDESGARIEGVENVGDTACDSREAKDEQVNSPAANNPITTSANTTVENAARSIEESYPSASTSKLNEAALSTRCEAQTTKPDTVPVLPSAHQMRPADCATLEDRASVSDVIVPMAPNDAAAISVGNGQLVSEHDQSIAVCRDKSAKGPPRKFPFLSYTNLPDGDCGDGVKNPYPKNEVDDKYWAQRFRLFSRFDEGIRLDRESWYSVTPEAIADHLATRIATETGSKSGTVVLDAFCGAGGNAIALAKRPEVTLVVCVDKDERKLLLTAGNAKVYGIPQEKLVLVQSDACKVLGQYSNGCCKGSHSLLGSKLVHGYRVGGLGLLPPTLDSVFLSPPWGGSSYLAIGPRSYDLQSIKLDDEVDGEEILQLGVNATQRGSVAYFLPRNANGLSIGKSVLRCGVEGKIEFEQNVLNNKLKSVTCYIGFVRRS